MKKTIKSLAIITCLTSVVAVSTFTTGCAGDRYHRSTGTTVDDASITARVKSEMIGDPDVKALQVDVDTYRGQVQLNGFVDSALQKQRAEQIAQSVQGVQTVRNNLVVKTDEPAGAKRPFQK